MLLPAVILSTGCSAKDLFKSANSKSEIQQVMDEYGDTYDYYLKTEKGVPLKLPIKNDIIPIILDSFSDEAKENAKYAISKMDDILVSKEFKVYDDGSKPFGLKYIKVSLVDYLESEYGRFVEGPAARTYLRYNSGTGKIYYPIEIKMQSKFIKKYGDFFDPKTPENSYFATVLQHELGHCLGLCDKYGKEDSGQTLMYYHKAGDVKGYTDLDIHNLRHIYDKEYDITVTKPTEMEVQVYVPQKEVESELSM